MAFETGTATDTFDLMSKLTTFMSAQSSWTLVSSPTGGRPTWDYDKVYYSTGSSGKNDIYIRQRVGEMEQFLRGAQQWDFGGGDTGFLNFFSYVNYPTDGDGYSGIGEVGTFGPRLYWNPGNTNFRLYRQDILSQRPGGSPHIVYSNPTDKGEPSEFSVDTHAKTQRRWTAQTGVYSTNLFDNIKFQPIASDGHRNMYFINYETGIDRAHRYSLQRMGGHYNVDGTVDRTFPLVTHGFGANKIIFVEERTTRRQYLYLIGASDDGVKINLMDNSASAITTFAWSDGSTSIGIDGACWDGGNFIYLVRADDTNDWAMYDIRADTWRTTTDPEDPEFRRLPVVPVDYSPGNRNGFEFIDKNISGYEHNRLYYADGSTDVLYMDLDDLTGLPYLGSFWQVQGNITTYVSYAGSGRLLANRYGKIFHFSFFTNKAINGIYEQFPEKQYAFLMHAPFTDGNFDWNGEDPNYYPERGSGGASGAYAQHELIDGYACRVKTSIDSSTTYVFIADEDRVIVATRANTLRNPSDPDNALEWSVAYMGAFESSYSATPYGELLEDVKAGFSRKVKLANRDGQFTEGNKYFIIDSTGTSYTQTHSVWNSTNRFANSEFIEVEMVEGNTITISPKRDYSAGSKIAIDPAPNGVFFWELEKFQATNVSNVLFDDHSGSDDTSKQTYTCAIPEQAVDNSATVAVANGENLPLWEYTMSTAEGEGDYIGTEVRGKMIGVYALGKGAGIAAGETVAVGDDSYYIIELPQYNKFMAIGPITLPQVPVTLPEYI